VNSVRPAPGGPAPFFDDGTSITSWRVREDHRPIGEIQRVPEEVYRRSSVERHRINGQPRVEPRSSAELLG
jgi:hypothetical protein